MKEKNKRNEMKRGKKSKMKEYVCKSCGSKSSKKGKCCGVDMVEKEE